MGMNGVNHLQYGQVSGTEKSSFHTQKQTEKPDFGEMLNFSKHAAKRLDERGIDLDNHLLGNLEHAVEEARRKGAKDVAVISSQGVFIVNVPNNVVVTTISQDDMKEKVFTNIDSAVFM